MKKTDTAAAAGKHARTTVTIVAQRNRLGAKTWNASSYSDKTWNAAADIAVTQYLQAD